MSNEFDLHMILLDTVQIDKNQIGEVKLLSLLAKNIPVSRIHSMMVINFHI